jgi:predicted O-methyltransferase YrrM
MNERYEFWKDWFITNEPEWKAYLGHLIGRPHLRFLEIGSYEGRSTVWLLENILTHETARIDCVDTFAGSVEHIISQVDMSGVERRFDHNIAVSGAGTKVTKIKATSREALRRLPFDSYDLVYVDGSHRARDVLEDAVLSFPLLKAGGTLIFDDYDWERTDMPDPLDTPRPGIDAFLAVYAREYDVVHKAHQVFLTKRLSG